MTRTPYGFTGLLYIVYWYIFSFNQELGSLGIWNTYKTPNTVNPNRMHSELFTLVDVWLKYSYCYNPHIQYNVGLKNWAVEQLKYYWTSWVRYCIWVSISVSGYPVLKENPHKTYCDISQKLFNNELTRKITRKLLFGVQKTYINHKTWSLYSTY